jgi:Flp pilus assembly pilin Flp
MKPLLARWAKNRDGIAAVEFAMLIPVMALIFFGMLEGSDLLTVNRRLAHSANALADLASQEPEVDYDQVDDMILGARRLLEPTSISTLSFRLVSIVDDPDNPGNPIVHWSRDQDGGTPYAAGSSYNGLDSNTSLNSIASLIVVEVDYIYDSGLTAKVFDRPYTFSRNAKRWPRKSTRVQLCNMASPAVCTE